MTQKKKKTFVRPTLTMSPFVADEILAGSAPQSFETGALDFGGTGTGSATTGGTTGGNFDWSNGQLGG